MTIAVLRLRARISIVPPGGGVPDGVRYEVVHDGLYQAGVGGYGQVPGVNAEGHLRLAGRQTEPLPCFGAKFVDIDLLTACAFGEVEVVKAAYVVEKSLESAGLLDNDAGGLGPVGGGLGASVDQGDGESRHGADGRGDFVGQIGEEAFLLSVGALELGGHAVEGPAQPGELFGAGYTHPGGEVPGGEPVGCVDRPPNGLSDRTHEHRCGQPGLGDDECGDDTGHERALRKTVLSWGAVVSQDDLPSRDRRADREL
jgi:hypothetical protein